MNTTKVSGIAIAAIAASLFVLAPLATAADAAATGKCVGGNSCKGKGFTTVTKADCDKAGGKFEGGK